MNSLIKEFPISIYGQLEKYNDVISKARCRIFYKYGNRNGTFITDEFAEELLKSLPYVPVKGIYDGDDYTDHGKERTEGRIYGIVPENPNVSWENHLDEDGVTREYACADVLIFTALYKESNEIINKPQSMELYVPSIQYHEAIINSKRYIVFDHGCFLGLQVLGEDVEPCFEGASFFSLQKTIEEAIDKIKEYTNQGGQSEMLNFKLSDDQKYNAIWTLLNTEYTEENNWTITYSICDVYDDYALAFNHESGEYERVYYSKNDENDSLEFVCKKKVYVLDITEEEKATLDTLRKLNGDTYELVSDVLTNAEDNANKVNEFTIQIEELNSKVEDSSNKIEELNASLSTLQSEAIKDKEDADTKYEELNAQYAAAIESINSLTEEKNSLTSYKLSIEKQQKEAVIAEYSEKLIEEVLNTYREKIDEYSVIDLDKELAYELKKTGSSSFANTIPTGYVLKDTPKSGIEEILSRYSK